MRDPDTHSDPGRAEPLTLDKNIVDRALLDPGEAGGPLRKLLQGLLFVRNAQLSNHAARGYQVGNLHRQ